MKKILFASLLSLSFSSIFADCSETSPVCVCKTTSCHPVQEIAQGYQYLLTNDFDAATIEFCSYLQNEFEKSNFIFNDDIESALVGAWIALAHKGAEKEVFEAIGRFFVNIFVNDYDDDFDEDFDEDFDDETDNLAYYLNTHYGIEKEQLITLIEAIKDTDLRNFVQKAYIE